MFLLAFLILFAWWQRLNSERQSNIWGQKDWILEILGRRIKHFLMDTRFRNMHKKFLSYKKKGLNMSKTIFFLLFKVTFLFLGSFHLLKRFRHSWSYQTFLNYGNLLMLYIYKICVHVFSDLHILWNPLFTKPFYMMPKQNTFYRNFIK